MTGVGWEEVGKAGGTGDLCNSVNNEIKFLFKPFEIKSGPFQATNL